MKVCAQPGCPELTVSTRCERHRKEKRRREDKRRPSARARGYDRKWERITRTFLRDNPVCLDCGGKATVSDHSPWTRKELLARGIIDPDLPIYLQPKCKPCHDRKTVTQDGGFGRVPVGESKT